MKVSTGKEVFSSPPGDWVLPHHDNAQFMFQRKTADPHTGTSGHTWLFSLNKESLNDHITKLWTWLVVKNTSIGLENGSVYKKLSAQA